MKPGPSDQRMYDSEFNRIHFEVEGQAEKHYSNEHENVHRYAAEEKS